MTPWGAENVDALGSRERCMKICYAPFLFVYFCVFFYFFIILENNNIITKETLVVVVIVTVPLKFFVVNK